MWEFPGGKVEAGETDLAALVRECAEELDVVVEPGGRLGPDIPLPGGGSVLRVWTATIIGGTPRAVEHRAIRWLTAGELDDVPWLPADTPLVAELREVLA
jgi:8-oxo-dGTP diphosphatase